MSDTQELVQIGGSSNVPAPVSTGYDTGLDSFSIKPSNLILVQPTTRNPKGARSGQFLDSLYEDVYDKVEVVPLKLFKQRVMFPPTSPGESLDLDAKPLCKSDDGLVPSRFVENPQALSCARCPMSVWKRSPSGKNIPSPCREKFRLLVVEKSTELPKYITIGGKSIPVLRQLFEKIKSYRIKAKAKDGLELEMFDFFFTLTSEKVHNAPYYMMRFEEITRVKNPSQFGPLFEQYAMRARADEEEAEEFAANDNAVDNTVSQVVAPEVIEAA
jgi:hypothetical protein